MTWIGKLLTVDAGLSNYSDLTKLLTTIRPNLELGNFFSIYLVFSFLSHIFCYRYLLYFQKGKLQRLNVQLSERFVSLGIMGEQLGAPENPQTSYDYEIERFKGLSIGGYQLGTIEPLGQAI